MSELFLSKVVSTLPTPLDANALYLVKVGTGFRPYVTNSTGTIVSYGLNPIDWSELTGKPSLLAAANNLSDIAAPATARTNLGVAWEVIERRVITSSTASAPFTGLGAFRRLRCGFRIIPVTANNGLAMRFSTNNGSSYDSTASRYLWTNSYLSPAIGYVGRSQASGGTGIENSSFELGISFENTIGAWGAFELEDFNQGVDLIANWNVCQRRIGTTESQIVRGGGWYTQTTARDAFTLFLVTGNIASATILVEGSRT